jgi:hypothetical protein
MAGPGATLRQAATDKDLVRSLLSGRRHGLVALWEGVDVCKARATLCKLARESQHSESDTHCILFLAAVPGRCFEVETPLAGVYDLASSLADQLGGCEQATIREVRESMVNFLNDEMVEVLSAVSPSVARVVRGISARPRCAKFFDSLPHASHPAALVRFASAFACVKYVSAGYLGSDAHTHTHTHTHTHSLSLSICVCVLNAMSVVWDWPSRVVSRAVLCRPPSLALSSHTPRSLGRSLCWSRAARARSIRWRCSCCASSSRSRSGCTPA